MKLRRFLMGDQVSVAVQSHRKWIPLDLLGCAEYGTDIIHILDNWPAIQPKLQSALADMKRDEGCVPEDAAPLLPFEPRSFRDFMLSEAHAVNAARGIVRRFLSPLYPFVKIYETLLQRPFPLLKPKGIWYRQPIYYMGNHMNFVSEGAKIEWPGYTKALDYELEMGFVITKPLKNATRDEALAAIGGFVVLNDFSARDVQLEEMRSGMGPQKAKHFINAISAEVASADAVLPFMEDLQGTVRINGQTVCNTSTKDIHHTIADALVHASISEQLHPGELFATGTLPGGCALENGYWLKSGDSVELSIDRVGTLRNIIG